jgi:hypothetical protein
VPAEKAYWCAAVVDALPQDFSTEGIVLQEGFLENAEYDPTEVHYLLLVRVKAGAQKEAHQFIKQTLLENGFPSVIKLMTVSDDERDIVRSERLAMRSMHLGEVLTKKTFLGFKRDNPKALENALLILRTAILRKRWQFWR